MLNRITIDGGEMTNDVESWFNSLSAEQKEPLVKLRKLILVSNKSIKEEIKWSRPCYTLNNLVCYLQKSKTHVTIGFYKGTQLGDPELLLDGQGKDMRHVKVGFSEKINSPAINKLIANAIKLDQP